MTDFRAACWFSKMGTDTQPLDLTVKKSVGIRGDCLFGEVFREKPCLDFFFLIYLFGWTYLFERLRTERSVERKREGNKSVFSGLFPKYPWWPG